MDGNEFLVVFFFQRLCFIPDILSGFSTVLQRIIFTDRLMLKVNPLLIPGIVTALNTLRI